MNLIWYSQKPPTPPLGSVLYLHIGSQLFILIYFILNSNGQPFYKLEICSIWPSWQKCQLTTLIISLVSYLNYSYLFLYILKKKYLNKIFSTKIFYTGTFSRDVTHYYHEDYVQNFFRLQSFIIRILKTLIKRLS